MTTKKYGMKTDRLHSVIRKCDNPYNRWCGYLQPVEIIILIESNLIQPNIDYQVDNAMKDINKGICNPRWFYFQPKPKFLELYRGLKRK